MGYKKKTWREKLAKKDNFPKIVKLEKNFPCYKAVHKMGAEVGDDIVLVNADEIIDCMKRVPRGRVTTIVEICKAIAKRHDVKGCCSLTTGIYIMTAANAAEEAKREEIDMDIPYWRTLKTDGFLNDKYPGGAAAHKRLLEREGLTVASKGKRFFVEDYQSRLFDDF